MPENSKKVKPDSKAIQTLFRTVIKNHYSLLQMIDRKSNIILTINSILISLMLGVSFIAPDGQKQMIDLITRSIINFGLISMVFAIFAIRPHNYKNVDSSLYSGVFTKMSKEDFHSKFKLMMLSGDTIYDNMIDDLYHLGKAIKNRQVLVNFAIGAFVLGILISLGISLFIS